MAQPTPTAPNSTNTVQLPRCKDNDPCIICWLRERMDEFEPTKSIKFDEKPLAFNIVGLRTEDTVSDRFDDHVLIFFRLLESKHEDKLEVVEKELRDSLTEAAKKVPKSVKCVPCASGLWVVALLQASTDPGFEPKPVTAKAALDKNLEATKKAQDTIKNAKVLSDEDINKEPKKTKRTKLRGEKLKAEKAITAAKDSLKDLEQKRPGLEAALAEAEATAVNVQLQPGEVAWEAAGRAILKPGQVSPYVYGVHHSGNPARLFTHSSTALGISSAEALRFYTLESLAADELERAASDDMTDQLEPQTYDVYQVGMGMTDAKQRFARGEAKISFEVMPVPKSKEVRLQPMFHGPPGARVPGPKDPVIVFGVARGTNIHRAHGLKFEDGKLRSTGTPHHVGDYSEGCQVFPNFYQYTLLIRLAAIHRKFKCGTSGPHCGFIRQDPESRNGPGEQALIAWKGLPYLSVAAAEWLAKDGRKASTEVEKLAKRKAKAEELNQKLDDNQTAQDSLAATPGAPKLKALQAVARTLARELEKHPWTSDDEEYLEAMRENGAEFDALAKELRAWGSAKLKSASAQVPDISEHAKLKRADFISDRVGLLGADFLRGCDLTSKCHIRFNYILLELQPDQVTRVEALFNRKENVPWNGDLCPSG